MKITTTIAILAIFFIGCNEEGENRPSVNSGSTYVHPTEPLKEEDIVIPDNYTAAVQRCSELADKIEELLKLDDKELIRVHRVAEEMMLVSRKLPTLAKKEFSLERLKEINITSKKLVDAFDEIDQVADAIKKDETRQVYHKMVETIKTLEQLAEESP